MQFPQMPAFQPINLKHLYPDSVNYDTQAYQLSDRDFRRRHPSLLNAEQLYEAQTLRDQRGNTELMPAVQNEFMRAGLSNTLGAFGDTPNTLAPGSAGEAGVARNLGNSIMGFQNMNRQNRTNSLLTSEQLFPRRTFGLTGSDVANIDIANTMGQNNWNQTNYANQVMMDQYQQQMAAQKKAQGAGQTGAIIQGAGAALGAIAMLACWVARAVYGNENEDWKWFRKWLFEDSAFWFFLLYLTFGYPASLVVRACPRFQSRLKPWMDGKVNFKKRQRFEEFQLVAAKQC